MSTDKICPFKIGDIVIYKPSARGIDLDTMSLEKLVPNKKYIIKDVRKGVYLTFEGYEHPGGGIYWTEFMACS